MKKKFIKLIKSDLNNWDIKFRIHATKRMFQRAISEEELMYIMNNGDIIEEYQEAFPLPCYLINGRTFENRPLHAIIGIDESVKILYIITVYEPDELKWSNNFTRRIE